MVSHKKKPLLHPEVTRFPTETLASQKSAVNFSLSFDWILHLSLGFGFGRQVYLPQADAFQMTPEGVRAGCGLWMTSWMS